MLRQVFEQRPRAPADRYLAAALLAMGQAEVVVSDAVLHRATMDYKLQVDRVVHDGEGADQTYVVRLVHVEG